MSSERTTDLNITNNNPKNNVNFIKSPLNYTGNKYRILNQIIKYFPKNQYSLLDLFCGGATVGINSNANKVYFVDNRKQIIDLLNHLAKVDFNKFLLDIESLIKKYNLSYSAKFGYKFYKNNLQDTNPNNGLKKYNEIAFYKLREDYNSLKDKSTDKANKLLYLLMVYGFNNDIRFSNLGNFNLPVGKTDLNKNNINKIKNYNLKISTFDYEFICDEFYSKNIYELAKTVDFVYMDPPYLITTAVYNENNGWSTDLEYKLLDFLNYLININKPFILSNVLEKRGKKNEPLSYWLYKNKDLIEVIDINYHYRSASYNKIDRNASEREIIVYFKGGALE